MRARLGTSAGALIAVAILGAIVGCDDNGDAPSQPSLTLSCTPSPSSGFVPLPVSLAIGPGGTDSVGLRVQWGDGTSSTEAFHVYTAPGRYTISVSATRPGQSATCNASVTAQDPPPRPPSRPPVFRARVNPDPPTGPAPLTVGFNMCDTVDPDGDPLFFSFDFGDGRRVESTFCRRDHAYGSGRFAAVACATDGEPGHDGCRVFEVLVP